MEKPAPAPISAGAGLDLFAITLQIFYVGHSRTGRAVMKSTYVKIVDVSDNGRVAYHVSRGTYTDGRNKGELKFMSNPSYGRIQRREHVDGEDLVIIKTDTGTPHWRLRQAPLAHACMRGHAYEHKPNI